MPTNVITASVLSVQLLIPVFNQFAERAGLEVKIPLDENRVTKSSVSIKPSMPGVMAVFDGHHQFNWNSLPNDISKGRISYYDRDSGSAFISNSRFRELAKETSLISTSEAKIIIERSLKNLGFDINKIKAGPPHLGQYTYRDNPDDEPMLVPLFGCRWFTKGVKQPEWYDRMIEIEVSGLTKKIVYFSVSTDTDKAFAIDLRKWLTNVVEKPKVHSEGNWPTATNILTAPALSVKMMLPAFNQFAERAGLDIGLPLEGKRVTKSYVGELSPSVMATFDHRHQFNWDSINADPYVGRILYRDLEMSSTMLNSRFRELTKETSLISTNEAKIIIETCLKNLGFDINKINAGPPHLGQYTYRQNPSDQPMLVPLFGCRWFAKGVKKTEWFTRGLAKPEWHDQLLEIEVSGLSKKVIYFSVSPELGRTFTIDLRKWLTNRIEKPK